MLIGHAISACLHVHISNLLESNVYCVAPMTLLLTISAAITSVAASLLVDVVVVVVIVKVDDVMFMFMFTFIVEWVAGVDVIVVGKCISCADMRKMSTRKLTAIVTK